MEALSIISEMIRNLGGEVHDVVYSIAKINEKIVENFIRTGKDDENSDMSKKKRETLSSEILEIMKAAVSDEYARKILEYKTEETDLSLREKIVENVMETSSYLDDGYYNEDDVRLSIGRELMEILGIES